MREEKIMRSSRATETRDEEMLDTFDIDYSNPLAFPPGAKKEGYTLYWARFRIRDQDDRRLEDLMNKGWTPVPVERCMKFANDPLDRNPLSKKFICFKDVMLVERPDVLCERQNKARIDERRARNRSMLGVSEDISVYSNNMRSINSF